MFPTTRDHLQNVLHRLQQVQELLGRDPPCDDPGALLADELDSMGLVELVALLAEDCGVKPGEIEQAVGHHFGTVRELVDALTAAGLVLRQAIEELSEPSASSSVEGEPARVLIGWLAAPVVRLPEIELAQQLDERLNRSPGWLETHAGIRQRHVWGRQDPLATAAGAGRDCLREAGLLEEEVGTLLVLSEAPPLPIGLAAALHHRIGLRPQAPALEVGGACSGFLAALWLARALLPRVETVLVLALEAPSLHLRIEPGEAGENAALFGDVAAACVLSRRATGKGSLPLLDVGLAIDGEGGPLLRVEDSRVTMDGQRLASRVIDTMACAVNEMGRDRGLLLDELAGVIVHGGNGRMAALAARRLGLPVERVWSQTSSTGNLGSASLLAAWEAHKDEMCGPVAWASVGAGLVAGWALTGPCTPFPGSPP